MSSHPASASGLAMHAVHVSTTDKRKNVLCPFKTRHVTSIGVLIFYNYLILELDTSNTYELFRPNWDIHMNNCGIDPKVTMELLTKLDNI